jgi:hypothetical protein
MGDIILRILLGFVILMFLGWLWTLLFGLFTGLVNGIALLLARGTRKLFGIDGQWDLGFEISTALTSLAKSVVTAAFWVALIGYAFLYPTGTTIWEISAGIAILGTLVGWMPSVFLMGLFAKEL